MPSTDGSNPFKAFLPTSRVSQSGMFCPASAFLVRSTPSDEAHAHAVDALDAFLVSCATEELPLDALMARLPCSRAAAMERVERLVDSGMLLIRRTSVSTPLVSPEEQRNEDCTDTVRPQRSANAPAVD